MYSILFPLLFILFFSPASMYVIYIIITSVRIFYSSRFNGTSAAYKRTFSGKLCVYIRPPDRRRRHYIVYVYALGVVGQKEWLKKNLLVAMDIRRVKYPGGFLVFSFVFCFFFYTRPVSSLTATLFHLFRVALHNIVYLYYSIYSPRYICAYMFRA